MRENFIHFMVIQCTPTVAVCRDKLLENRIFLMPNKILLARQARQRVKWCHVIYPKHARIKWGGQTMDQRAEWLVGGGQTLCNRSA